MPYSQEGRPIRISTKLGTTELLLERFSGMESISCPFEFHLGLLSENRSIDLSDLLRSTAVISVELADGSCRYIHGLFNRLKQLDMGKDLVAYEATLVPRLWFLSLTADCRIFQNKSVPDIVEQILKDNQVTDYKLQLSGSYPKRDYCVQYRETDLNFISRLMEDEGIFYFFEHAEDKHTMVIANRQSAVAPCPSQARARYSPLPGGGTEEDNVLALERQLQVHTGKISLQDYDFEKPNTSLMSTMSGPPWGEVYDYPGGYLVRGEGDRYARLQLEAQEVSHEVVRGSSRCRAFLPGYRFTLEDHYRDDVNAAYTLVSVRHEAVDNNYRAPQSQPFEYSNEFEAIPHSVAYRPPRRARKPVVEGSQTALVVGKSGEEIWVDKYGRVKVQFYWDREGKRDENSSCWVRVAQIWAGKNWGWVTLPRIGQEVIVDFLEGDPDRPIITGRVYNADQMPPYALPANQTQSGIKSRSSKGGGTSDFNEIRFEDKKGQEMLTVHAQKDMETTVEHDDTQTVQNNRTITVDGTHTETIKKDTTITITQGNSAFTLDQGNSSITLKMGNETTKINLGKSETEAMQSIELKVGQSSVKLDQAGVTIKGLMIKVEGTAMLQAKAPMTQVNGDGMLMLKGGITMIN